MRLLQTKVKIKAYTPKISDEAVRRATGKNWKEWFLLMDRAGAKKLRHADIARFLYGMHRGSDKAKSNRGPDVADRKGWWPQMITVEYERSRGLRAVNQNEGGFNVSIHGTFPVSVSKLFGSWRKLGNEKGLREGTVRRNKTIRYKREKGGPLYVAAFAAKDRNASRIGFEAMHLAKAEHVEKERTKWRKTLLMLKNNLDTRPVDAVNVGSSP